VLSFVINSIDASRFDAARRAIVAATRGARVEVVGVHDARSMCDGYRRGLAASRGDLVVFCHDDVEFLSPDLPARLAHHARRFDVFGPVGTRKLVSMNWADAGAEHLYGAMTGPGTSGQLATTYFGGEAIEVDGIVALEGACIVARREAAVALGWDAETFDGWHGYDADFSFRAHRAAWRVGVVLDLPMLHFSPGTLGPAYERAKARFAAKHAGALASGQSHVHQRLSVPMRDRAAVRAFFATLSPARLHAESRVRIDRARASPAARRLAGSAAVLVAEPPRRNGACPCGSGLRFKSCHGVAAPRAHAVGR
jgi:hypothetical protein